MRRILHGVTFLTFYPMPSPIFFCHILVQKGGGQSEVQILDLYMIEKMLNQSTLSVVSLMMQNMDCDTTKTH